MRLKFRARQPLWLLPICTLISSFAQADTITNAFGNGTFNGNEVIPLFDPTLGTLTGVSAFFYSNQTGAQSFTVVNPSSSVFTNVQYGGSESVSLAYGASSLFNYTQSLLGTGSLAAYTGTQGNVYTQYVYPLAGRAITTVGVDVSSIPLSLFVATASSPKFSGTPYLAFGPLSASFGTPTITSGAPGAYINANSETDYSAVPIYVTYTYTPSGSGGGGGTPPVPLPAAAWLMLSGLGGLGAMLRKKKVA